MARPLRIEFPGAHCHVTSRGDRREAIYEDDEDRVAFLDVLGAVVTDFEWQCLAYCLMTNHYHLFVQTAHGNLSKGMRQLNGVFTQWSNRRHRRSGHLFQGRYKGILVDSDSYFREVSRYVVLNPVRAGMVADPADWPWSSYRATAGLESPPSWLAVDAVLAAFGRKRAEVQEGYRRFVLAGIGADSIWSGLSRQVFLGDGRFVEAMQRKLGPKREDVQIPRAQRRGPPPTLAEIREQARDRDEAIVRAHATGEYSYSEIGDFFGLHFTTVGRIVRRAKGSVALSPNPSPGGGGASRSDLLR
jgi:REP element-mobilizing transposase RayT